MAKKIANAPVELKGRDLALSLAQERAEIDAKIKELNARKEAITEHLEQYYNDTGETDLGALRVTVTEPKPTIDFGALSASGAKRVQGLLIEQLPDFVNTKKELDLERLYLAASNPVVANALKANGVTIKQETKLRFSAVKD